MVSSYVRIRCTVEEAMSRYGRWIGRPELGPPRLVAQRDKIEEVSGGLAQCSSESWLELAQGGDLVYAGYNDTVPYAQLIMIEQGRLIREYLQDEQDSSEDVDVGRLPEEAEEPFGDWIDVMGRVEADENKLVRPGKGWLWIHRAA